MKTNSPSANLVFFLKCRFIYFFLFLQNLPIKLDSKKYACPYCQKTMAVSRDMMRHIQTHTGEKPFSCDFCQYSSNRNSNLRIHMKNTHNIMFWKYIHLANKVLAFSWKTILYSSTHLIFLYDRDSSCFINGIYLLVIFYFFCFTEFTYKTGI